MGSLRTSDSEDNGRVLRRLHPKSDNKKGMEMEWNDESRESGASSKE